MSSKKFGPLVLVHGMWGISDMHYILGIDLSRNRDVYIPSLRGHGDSTLTSKPFGHMTIKDYLEDVCRVLEWIPGMAEHDRFKNISIIGHSMGGLLALKASSVYPLRHVTLINSAPPRGIVLYGISSLFLPKYLWRILRRKQFKLSTFDRRLLLGNSSYGHEDSDGISYYASDYESGQAALDVLLGGMSVDIDEESLPRSLQVISGMQDRMIHPSIQKKIASRYGATSYVRIETMSHMIDNSTECFWEVERFHS
ncbi:MAG: alpha/beta fold hydrolase [Candidatus Paceibacterota bacterium]